ncbi:MAG TPA: prephenate dehydrogenase [Saprospiraceae bacterium]|nr:prephenate dehydrogenase [Saprospiraceae bacterium]
MKITVIGLGLIGGSIAKDLKSQLNVKVYGVDASESHQKLALDHGLVHEIVSLDEGLKLADIVILAIPVDKIEGILPNILDQIDQKTTVIDVGSTKSDICNAISLHPKRRRFVAAHPLAGTEFSGPTAALKGLFQNKKNIITEPEKSDADALESALRVFESLGMVTSFMTAEEHDKHLAYVSHLSHVSSFMLGLTVLDIEKDEKQIFELASTGFESTVRLAKSNPKTWSAIFGKNKKYLLEALDSYIVHLENFRHHIRENNTEETEKLMHRSNDIKRILK